MNLNIKAPLNHKLGYGVAGINIVKGLAKNNEVALFPIGQGDFQSREEKQIIEKCLQNQTNFDYKAPCLQVWHEHSLAERIGNGIYATISFFEINKLDTRRINNLNSSDIIFCPSKWAKTVYKKHNINAELVLCPMGIDTNIFRPIYRKKNENYKFFNIGKIEIRKGHDILCDLFNNAFTQGDNVELHIKWNNPFLSPEEHQKWANLYKNTPLGNKIFFHNTNLKNLEFCQLINEMDCVILPTRAEGWNFPAIQALSCGKALIITNYSAHTEFCNSENSFLIEIDEMESAYDGKWFFGDAEWAKIGNKQQEQTIEYMRKCYSERISTNENGVQTAKKFSWKKTVEIIEEKLKNGIGLKRI
jgi:glycosyltransferase involved in cell wall biosynthesis